MQTCGIRLYLVTSHWQATLLVALQKGEQWVSLSLPVHSLTTSPMQCLLVAASVILYCKASTLNQQGQHLSNLESGWGHTRRVCPNGGSGGRGETPNSCQGRRGLTKYKWPNGCSDWRGENSQWLWKQKRTYIPLQDGMHEVQQLQAEGQKEASIR